MEVSNMKEKITKVKKSS